MKNKNSIVILGFGRSGTTWISDIVSKMLGGLILFEPFHPAVYNKAKESCYHNATNPDLLKDISKHTDIFLEKGIKDKWLLRNHLSSNLNEVSDFFVSEVWKNCAVIGYKSIRQNFMIPWIYENVSSKIVYLKRDILSVVSSCVRRKQFWEEFGFDFHEEKFLKETLQSSKYAFLNTEKLTLLYSSLDKDYLKMAFIWVVTHIIVERELTEKNIPLFHYKDFYINPYEATAQLAEYLEVNKTKIHPSYIFTPSMLTLRTFHKEADDFSSEEDSLAVFWKDTLDETMVLEILNMEEEINALTS